MLDSLTDPTRSHIEEEQRRHTAYLVKTGVLFVLTLGAAIILGQYLSYSFYENVFSIPDIALPAVITFAVFLTFFFHSVLFIQKKSVLSLLAICSTAAIVVSFFSLADAYVVVGTLGCLLFMLFAVYETKSEISTRIKIRFVHALNSVTTKVILAIAILLGATLYSTFTTRNLDEDNFLFPRPAFEQVISWSQGPLKTILGDVDFSKSLRQIAEQKVDETIAAQAGGAAVPAGARQQLVNQYVAELQKSFLGITGTALDENQPLSKTLYDGLLHRVNTADAGTKSVILGVLVVLFIFSIQLLSILVRIALIPIAYLVYELLLRTHFAHIVYENASKEVVTL
jgi:hypothetical protein